MADKKKTLYHGEFRDMGPVKVVVKSEPLESKYKKGTFFVELSINGETRNLNPENDDITEFFRGRKGETITVVAEGSREEATVVLVGEVPGTRKTAQPPRGKAQDQEPRNEPPGKTTTAPKPDPHHDPVWALANAKQFVGKNRTLALIGLKAAMSVAKVYEDKHGERMPDCLLTAIYTSMVFGSSAAGIQHHLPNNIDYENLTVIHPEKKGAK